MLHLDANDENYILLFSSFAIGEGTEAFIIFQVKGGGVDIKKIIVHRLRHILIMISQLGEMFYRKKWHDIMSRH